jgi:hypothetical protein
MLFLEDWDLDLDLQIGAVSFERINYGHRFCGTRAQE